MPDITARSVARAYRSSIVLGIGCLVLGLVAAVVTAQRHGDAQAFRRDAVAATGTVVERRDRFGGAARDDVIVVEIPVAAGSPVRAEVVVDTVAMYEDGDRVVVLQSPEHPERAVLPDLPFPVRGAALSVVSFVAGLILLGACSLQAVRLRRASRSALRTEVTVRVGPRRRSALPLVLTAPDGRSLVLPVPRSQLRSVRDRMVARGELRPGGTVYLEDGDVIVHPSAPLRSSEGD
ncbi:MAG: hypothetical protein ACLGI3_05615 [Actinomycetes bacterium]